MKFKEGDRVVSCGQVPGMHASGYYFGTKVYEATVRKRDNVLIWKLALKTNIIACGDHRIRGNFASPEAIKLARVYATENGLPYVADVKDKQEVEDTKVPRSQAARVKKRVPKGDRLDRVRAYVEGE
jgi:hypothetical protein